MSRIAVRAGGETASTSRDALLRRADRARADLQQNPDDVSPVIRLGDTLLRLARVTGSGGRALEAERVLVSVLTRNPEHYEARRLLATTYLSLHRFRDALREGARYLAANPKDASVYGIVGDAHLELGEYDQAFASFDSMNALKPSAASYARAAYARELQGDLTGALDVMKMALGATAPSDVEAVAWHHVQLGHLYFEMGRTADAWREYTHAEHVFPDHPMAGDGMARVAAAAGRTGEALAIVKKRLNDAPRADGFALAGDLLSALGQSDEARRHYLLAEAAWRSDTPEPARLARFLADRGRADEAVRMAEAAIAERRDIFTADALAWAYFRAGRLEDARKAMSEARRTGTRDREILRHAEAMGLTPTSSTTLAER
jgi:tetratricopeptide (TPR) repeat protein